MRITFFLLFFAVASTIFGQQAQLVKNPVPPTSDLNRLKNNQLQTHLTAYLNADKKLAKLIQQKKLAVGVIDLKNQFRPKYASVNGNEMMYAASLPKIAVLLAAVDAIEKGELQETPEVTRDMHLMIRKSNNAASTRMIDRVGYEKIAAVMTSPTYQLYNKNNGGGLWVGKRYAAAGKRFPDPLKGISHAATVEAVCKYYYLLSQEKLINPERSRQMKEILVDPGLHHKFVNTLDKIAPKAKIYRKSGSWRTFHSDSVWVHGPNRNYILVALIDDVEGEKIARRLVNIAEKAMKGKKFLASK
ncbi:MAG: serine hydrolase [Bacteroidota bacterium]